MSNNHRGNVPGLDDGATAILFMCRQKSPELSLESLASMVAMISVAIDPFRMPETPGLAMMKALQMAHLRPDDIDFTEINEALAAVPLASMKFLCRTQFLTYPKVMAPLGCDSRMAYATAHRTSRDFDPATVPGYGMRPLEEREPGSFKG